MKLYHGSNMKVINPKTRLGLRALDFGAGFYMTSDKEQAVKWAKIVARRRRSGKATVSIYTLYVEMLNCLNILKFEKADADWLDFVVSNRKEHPFTETYDLVIGPVANDNTLPVIDDYMDGVYTKEEAVSRLLPQKLTDQYAFLTDKAIALLAFEGSEQQ